MNENCLHIVNYSITAAATTATIPATTTATTTTTTTTITAMPVSYTHLDVYKRQGCLEK